MLDFNPPPPEGWTPLHSVAYLLLGVALSDERLDEKEAERIVDVMARYQHVDREAAMASLALAHAYLMVVAATGGRQGYLDSIVRHAALLANRYGREMLSAVLSDMVAIALADDEVSEAEMAFILSTARAWGLEIEA